MNKALFLDRDGVINTDKNYVHRVDEFEFIDGIFDLCKRYQDSGYLIFVITNQAGIARGLYTEEQFAELTAWMVAQFATKNIIISHVYHCPHHPGFTGDCDCRKPNPGMIFQAQRDYDLDLVNSVLIGDKQSDIDAGKAAGIKYLILKEPGISLQSIPLY